ncbi:MAG TPA: cobalamin-binding protein [Gammaproteobacteria bacterium]|jgi:iron complex transport system substrate-binding protein|nr:cobalamin-binding protein [Gammaproteobacteria bacterium]
MKYGLAFFLVFFAIHSFACVVIDDTNAKVQLSQPAKRIVSLAPDLTENLFTIGAGSQIVGVVQGSDYPVAAQKIRKVATHHSVDLEAILLLHPDLIIAWADSRYIAQLKKLPIPLYLNKPTKILDIPKILTRLGCLTGHVEQSNKVANDFYQRYTLLKNKNKDKKNITLFYQIWFNPLMTVTQKSWIDDAITTCGAKNIFAELPGVAPIVNLEAVIQADPEVILASDADLDFKKHWASWKRIRAVKNQNLYTIPADFVERASVRLLDGVAMICGIVGHLSCQHVFSWHPEKQK